MSERNPELMTVWIFKGPNRGTFNTVTPEEGQRLIDEGCAQDCRLTDGMNFRKIEPAEPTPAPEDRAEYTTRELRAAEPGRARRGRSRN